MGFSSTDDNRQGALLETSRKLGPADGWHHRGKACLASHLQSLAWASHSYSHRGLSSSAICHHSASQCPRPKSEEVHWAGPGDRAERGPGEAALLLSKCSPGWCLKAKFREPLHTCLNWGTRGL